MRKGLIFVSVCTIVLLLAMVPLTNASPQGIKYQNQTETTVLQAKLGKETYDVELSVDTIESLIEMGKQHKVDFLTIYNKYSNSKQVTQAFENLQPFFNELVKNGIGESVDNLNSYFDDIRSKIRKPLKDPQTKGGWNGIPTPLFGNVACGIFSTGFCIGLAIGTHTILPTLGIDLIMTWFGEATTATIGLVGYTTSTLTQGNIAFGFLGLLLTTPIIIAGLYFMTGFCGIYSGAGPAPC